MTKFEMSEGSSAVTYDFPEKDLRGETARYLTQVEILRYKLLGQKILNREMDEPQVEVIDDYFESILP